MENHTDPNSTEGGPNTSEQSTNNNQTTSEWMERSKYKIPILWGRETDLTKINPKMRWEQISEYIHSTYSRNLDEIIDQGTEYMDPHTVYHMKGDVIYTSPQSQTRNHERSMVSIIKRRQFTGLTDIIQENIPSSQKRIP